MNARRMSGWGVVATLTLGGAGSAGARLPFSEAPKPNPIQAKYFNFVNAAGGLECQAKGAVQALISAPNECYLDLDECPPSKAAVEGKLSPEFLSLFGDLLTLGAGDEVTFAYACPGGDDDKKFYEHMAIQGLGYAKASEHLDKLLALATPERLSSFTGAAPRALLVEALMRMGVKHKDAVVPALANLVKAEAKTLTFKAEALQVLARYQSDLAVDYCMEQLKTGESKSLHDACILYLGERKVKDAVPVLLRNFEGKEEVTSRALGLIGDPAATETLKALVDKRGAAQVPHALVALVNIGETKAYLPALQLLLEGKAPLTAKDEERKAKDLNDAKNASAKTKADRMKRAKEKWEAREAEVDGKRAQIAAMEATYLVNATAEKAVTATLEKVGKTVDAANWKPGVYARLALAQRGDKAAAGQVAKLLADNKADIRMAALQAVGGLYDAPGATFAVRGRGVVADAALIPALVSFMENEQKAEYRTKALHAIAAIRSFE